jgi:hypothetical protein
MRTTLARQEGQRKKFQGIFVRLGKKVNFKGHSEETILLKNIFDLEAQRVVADHIWFSYTTGFQKIRLEEGCLVSFEARVRKYVKGYVNRQYKMDHRREDFKLSHPTKISLEDR